MKNIKLSLLAVIIGLCLSGFSQTGYIPFSVTQNALPTPAISGTLSYCAGLNTTLQTGNYSTYNWSSGSSTQSSIVTTANNPIAVTVTDANGCSGTSASVNVTQNALPTPAITGTLSYCAGSNTTLNAGAYTSYLWSTGATTQTINATTANNPITVTVTDANGCSGTSAIVNVMQNALPTPAITGTLSYCAGSNTTLQTGNYSTYNWSSGSSTQSSIVTTANNPVTVTVTDANGCSGTSASVNVMQNALPTPAITGTLSYCAGSNTTLQTGNYSTYNWSSGSSTQSSIVTTANNPVTVTVTDANGCSGTSASVNVMQNVLPTPAITGTLSYCAGSNTTLNAGVYTSYLWSTGATTQTINATTANNPITVTVTDANGCSGTSASVNVTQNALPTPAITGTLSYCAGSNTTLNAGVYTSYLWSTGATTQTINATTANNPITVTVTNANGCSGTSASVNVTQNALPTIYLGNDTIICANASITLTGTGSTGSFYHWSNGLTGSAITVSNSGVYTVTVTNGSGCSASDNIMVTKYAPIQIVINAVNTICGQQMGSATAFVTGGTQPYHYLWSNGDTTDVALNLASGIYVLYITDLNNCQNSATALISTSNGPSIAVQNVTNVSCYGGSNGAISILVSGGTQPYHLEWSNGDTLNQSINNLAVGPYEIIVIDNAGCQAVRSINITQPDNISLSITSSNATCGNTDGSATISVSGGTSPYTYVWSNGVQTQNLSSVGAGVYTLTVTDTHSCIATNTTVITETGAPTVTIDSITNSSCSANNGAIYISVSGTGTFIYNWSDGSHLQDLTGITAGSYNVTVSSGGCTAIANTLVSSSSPIKQTICIVTVDNTLSSPKNMIVWEKELAEGILHYKIYKESSQAGVYQNVANVPYASMSKWSDLNSNPKTRAYRYKIMQVDSCGNESEYSEIHKTIHLTINQGQGQDMNLIWNHYQGFDYSTYYIYRYHASTGWLAIDSIPGDLNTYTDTPPNNGNVKYKVAAKRDNECWASGNTKDMSGPFSQSLSNIEDNGIIDVGIPYQNTSELNMKIYPNPTNDKFTIELSKNGIAEIIDLQGRIIKSVNLQNVKTIIDLQDCYSGIYSIRIKTDKEIIVKKLIKQ